MKTKLFLPLYIIFSFAISLSAQTFSNLDVIYSLINKSVSKADSLLGGKQTIYLSIITPQMLEVLKPNIIQAFNQQGYILKSSENEAAKSVIYTLTSAKVVYKNSFSDGLFGGLSLEREISFNYSLTITGTDKTIKSFSYLENQIDTVKLDEISGLENKTLPFTKSSIPSTPLLSNLWEPIIVVGTLIVTIVLLFSIRSK